MEGLLIKIDQDLKQAMIAKDELSLAVIRMLKSSLRNKEISLRAGDKVELNNEQVLDVIKSEVKKRKDSVDSYLAGNRSDLADKEKAEIGVLEKYLPAQMSDEDLDAIIKEIVAGAENKDFGRLMGQVMARVKGQADGGRVSAVLKNTLN